MEPRPLARSVLAIPELLDLIIGFLSGSRVNLLSCALVSKSWVPCAQRRIFRNIILYSSKDMKLLRRLTETLETSPHLAHFIRRLSISLNIRLLEGVVGMTLPRLEELSVKRTIHQYFHFDDTKTKFLVQSLLRRPTIRGVELHGSFTSMSVIRAYFDNCAHIQRVGLMNAHVEHPLSHGSGDFQELEEASNSDPSDSALVASKRQLSRITFPFSVSQALYAWLVGPHCPFGFQYLRSVQIREPRWRSFHSLLAPGLESIEYLKLRDFSGDHVLDLSGLSKLKQLDVYVSGRSSPLPGLIAALESLPPNNNLQAMGLTRYFVSAKDEKFFRDFDATITTLDVMHSLRRVEINNIYAPGSGPGLDIATFRSYFPTLSSKSYLCIHFSAIRR
ncbi:hypothetical protein MSAN_00346300 [Mycena sanguinolenta]|uniref:F-box domain-containing protein n=1 Tax=Mycena sanguinolenta TaxID=230812 RepID=A0A8H6ZC08_9AGAR|nr:hypothetical protein MSAN_00346300 [Mycena sanguinolenta]